MNFIYNDELRRFISDSLYLINSDYILLNLEHIYEQTRMIESGKRNKKRMNNIVFLKISKQIYSSHCLYLSAK